jgi:hypothetical protein
METQSADESRIKKMYQKETKATENKPLINTNDFLHISVSSAPTRGFNSSVSSALLAYSALKFFGSSPNFVGEQGSLYGLAGWHPDTCPAIPSRMRCFLRTKCRGYPVLSLKSHPTKIPEEPKIDRARIQRKFSCYLPSWRSLCPWRFNLTLRSSRRAPEKSGFPRLGML